MVVCIRAHALPSYTHTKSIHTNTHSRPSSTPVIDGGRSSGRDLSPALSRDKPNQTEPERSTEPCCCAPLLPQSCSNGRQRAVMNGRWARDDQQITALARSLAFRRPAWLLLLFSSSPFAPIGADGQLASLSPADPRLSLVSLPHPFLFSLSSSAPFPPLRCISASLDPYFVGYRYPVSLSVTVGRARMQWECLHSEMSDR